MKLNKSSEKYLEKEIFEKGVIKIENYSGYWKKTKEEETEAVLKDINLEIKPGSLNAIIGPIGSGKSALLMALLDEIPFSSGKINSQ